MASRRLLKSAHCSVVLGLTLITSLTDVHYVDDISTMISVTATAGDATDLQPPTRVTRRQGHHSSITKTSIDNALIVTSCLGNDDWLLLITAVDHRITPTKELRQKKAEMQQRQKSPS